MQVHRLGAQFQGATQPVGFDRQLESMAGAAQAKGIAVVVIHHMAVGADFFVIHLQKDIGAAVEGIVTGFYGDRQGLPNGGDAADCRLGNPGDRLLVFQHAQQARRGIGNATIGGMHARRQADAGFAHGNLRHLQRHLPNLKQLLLAWVALQRPLLVRRERGFAHFSSVQEVFHQADAALVFHIRQNAQIHRDHRTQRAVLDYALGIDGVFEDKARHLRVALGHNFYRTLRGALTFSGAIKGHGAQAQGIAFKLLLNWQAQGIRRGQAAADHIVVEPEFNALNTNVIANGGIQLQHRADGNGRLWLQFNAGGGVFSGNWQVDTNLRVA